METTGATTPTCAKLLKTLSEIAHRRRSHNANVFKRRWTVDWGMVLAKRGADAALSRTLSVTRARNGIVAGVIGPMLSEDAEPALVIGGGYSGGG